MKAKKTFRVLMLLIFIFLATILPFPIKFYKKDNLPSNEIEQIDDKEEDEMEEKNYQAFS